MNQLTVKVRYRKLKHTKVFFLFDKFDVADLICLAVYLKITFFSLCYNSILGPEKTWSVYRVFLLQHSEACDQPPAEVVSVSLLVISVTVCFFFFSLKTSLPVSCSGSEALLYHLSEVRGMSLWKQKFERLGLDSDAIDGTLFHTDSVLSGSQS